MAASAGAAEAVESARFAPKMIAALPEASETELDVESTGGMAAFVTLDMVGAVCPKATSAKNKSKMVMQRWSKIETPGALHDCEFLFASCAFISV
jgi:hypothetical protein